MSMGITDPLELLQQENADLQNRINELIDELADVEKKCQELQDDFDKLDETRVDAIHDRDKEIERLTKIMDKAIAILSD